MPPGLSNGVGYPSISKDIGVTCVGFDKSNYDLDVISLDLQDIRKTLKNLLAK